MEDQKEREKIIMRWLPQLLKSWFGVNATVEVKGGQEIHAEEGKKKEEEKKTDIFWESFWNCTINQHHYYAYA